MEINSRAEANVIENMCERLMDMDENLKYQPMLATGYKLLDDNKTWQFKLREDVKFWDGEPLTAEVVKFVFDRGLGADVKFTGNTPGYVFPSIGLQKVEVVDPYTVNFVLDRFEPDAPGYLSEVYIHSMKYYKESTPEQIAAEPMCSGAFKFTEWVKDDHVTMDRWDGYWGEKPNLKTIVWRVIPESSTAVAELLAGSVNVVAQVPPDQAPTIDKSESAKMAWTPGGRRIYIGQNQNCEGPGCKEVKDVKVRQALNMAVDVDTILKNLFAGRGEREGGIVNPPHKSADIKAYPYDPEGAKKLLAEAGYPDGFRSDPGHPQRPLPEGQGHRPGGRVVPGEGRREGRSGAVRVDRLPRDDQQEGTAGAVPARLRFRLPERLVRSVRPGDPGRRHELPDLAERRVGRAVKQLGETTDMDRAEEDHRPTAEGRA